MLTGSCLCRRVRYQINGPIYRFVHCHCRTCRKVHGTVYGSSALVQNRNFQVVGGEDAVTRYESSPGKLRCFCSVCGTHVFAQKADEIILRVGTLDADPGIRPEAHIWMGDKAPWYEVCDELPKYNEGIAQARGVDPPMSSAL
jgi:hypothetical protein